MELLRAPELQGIAALIAILQVVIAVVKSLRSSTPVQSGGQPNSTQPSSGSTLSPIKSAIGSVVLLIVSWVIYCIPWVLLALAMSFPPSMVLSALFFALGAFTALGVLVSKFPMVGGFLGGSIPLGALALFYTSSNAQMFNTASPLAWFGVFFIFGGLIGAVTGPAALRIVQMLGLPVRLW
jgi:hypothetical protein